MGATIDGETYYWSEFNLRADDQTSATLVFEETDDGGDWKLFTDFTPEFRCPPPMPPPSKSATNSI